MRNEKKETPRIISSGTRGSPLLDQWIDRIESTRIGRWGYRGALAFVDQGLFSGSNFILSILLGRWLLDADYGAYSVAYSIFIFFIGFHGALILEPMSVIGPSKYLGKSGEYIRKQIRLHFGLTSLLGIFLFCAGGIAYFTGGKSVLAEAIMGAGLALPMILFIYLVRLSFYMIQKPIGAALSSSVYLLILFGLLVAARHQNLATSFSAFLIMGLAAIAGGGLVLWKGLSREESGNAPAREEESIRLRDMIREQWMYGRWILATLLFNTIASQIQVLATAGLVNLGSAGSLRAIQNFIQPMVQTSTAITLLAVPSLAMEFGRGNLTALRRKGYFITLVLTGLAIGYVLFLWAATVPLEQIAYGGKYASFDWLFPWAGIVAIFTAIGTGFSVMLRAIQRPQYVLLIGIIAAPVGVLSSLLFIPRYGVAGSIASSILTSLISLLITIVLFFLWFPKANTPAAERSL